MKQRRPKRRKTIRQPRKQLPPTSTDKPPPLDWLTEQTTPPRVRARNPALISSGIVQPPSAPRRPALDPVGTPEGPLPTRSAAAAIQLQDATLQADATVVRAAAHIERRISEQPAAIRDSARALSKELKSQADELKQHRPNDPDRITQRDNLVGLFEHMATGLANLADNLDQAISKASEGKPEPVFLGKAADVAHGLHLRLMEWLEENRTTLFEVPFRVGIFAAGVAFLYYIGADSAAALGALGYVVGTAKKKGGENKFGSGPNHLGQLRQTPSASSCTTVGSHEKSTASRFKLRLLW